LTLYVVVCVTPGLKCFDEDAFFDERASPVHFPTAVAIARTIPFFIGPRDSLYEEARAFVGSLVNTLQDAFVFLIQRLSRSFEPIRLDRTARMKLKRDAI